MRGGAAAAAARWPATPTVVTPAPPLAPAAAKCGCAALPACSCDAVMGYLQCLTPKCLHGCQECSNHPSFEEQCLIMQSACGDDLALGCGHNQSTCGGKWHQLASGVAGLRVRAEALREDAYCGPHGNCIGALRLQAVAHKAEPGAWLQCAAPRHAGADVKQPGDWLTCGAAIDATGKGGCVLDMRQ